MFYILKDKKVVEAKDIREWAEMFEKTENRIVKQDHINNVKVSTVFTGVDIFSDNREPQLFQTRVFGGAMNNYVKLYPTWEEAEKGHDKIYKILQG